MQRWRLALFLVNITLTATSPAVASYDEALPEEHWQLAKWKKAKSKRLRDAAVAKRPIKESVANYPARFV